LPQDIKIYLIGGNIDNDLCEKIINESVNKNILNLSGKLKILQTASLMKNAIMNFVNDSAPLHICSAMNASATAVFCSTVPSFGFYPLSDDSCIVEIEEDLECRPCGIHGHKECPKKHFNCAEKISIDLLLNRIKK
jgi:heptosyltransferase-2